MRTARAKVVNGKIVTRAKFPEGTKLVLVVDEPKPPIVIDEEDERAFDEAVAAVREGKTIPVGAVRGQKMWPKLMYRPASSALRP